MKKGTSNFLYTLNDEHIVVRRQSVLQDDLAIQSRLKAGDCLDDPAWSRDCCIYEYAGVWGVNDKTCYVYFNDTEYPASTGLGDVDPPTGGGSDSGSWDTD